MPDHRCDAYASGRVVTDWGHKQLPCQARAGLRTFTDAAGIVRFFCPANGHEANAKRRFGQAEEEDPCSHDAVVDVERIGGIFHASCLLCSQSVAATGDEDDQGIPGWELAGQAWFSGYEGDPTRNGAFG